MPALSALKNLPRHLFSGVSRFAFSGTRIEGYSAQVAGFVAEEISDQLRSKTPDLVISVGDASGVDAAVRRAAHPGDLSIFRVEGTDRADFARRSVRCVQSVLPAFGSLLLAFPADACPRKVDARPRFAGHGSGTWGTVGFALGHGIRVLLFVPHREHDPLKWCGPLKPYATILNQNYGGTWVQLQTTVQPTLF